MAIHICSACGTAVPAYYLSRGLCDDCKWDTWIPRGYAAREKYAYSETWRHYNATRRPSLGVDFLDRKPFALNDLLPMCGRKPQSSMRLAGGDTSKNER